MSEFMDVINAFGTPLKIAWVGWIAWGVGQYFWFRHERSAPSFRKTADAKPAVKKPAVPKPIAVQAAEAPVVGRLFTPTHVTVGRQAECSRRATRAASAHAGCGRGRRRAGTGLRSVEGRHRNVRSGQRKCARQVRQGFRNAGCASPSSASPSDGAAFIRRRGAANPVAPRDHKTRGGSPRSRLCAPGRPSLPSPC